MSNYEKPKVTIDIEEYSDLLTAKKSLNSDEQVLMAKTVVAALLNNKGDAYKTMDELRLSNIQLSVSGYEAEGKIKNNNVFFKRISTQESKESKT